MYHQTNNQRGSLVSQKGIKGKVKLLRKPLGSNYKESFGRKMSAPYPYVDVLNHDMHGPLSTVTFSLLSFCSPNYII